MQKQLFFTISVSEDILNTLRHYKEKWGKRSFNETLRTLLKNYDYEKMNH